MMKTLDRPETFSKKFAKAFSSKISKKGDAMLLVTGFATVYLMKLCYLSNS